MARIRHIAITAEDPFVTAELMKQAFGLEEIGRGDSDLAREVYLTDGYINLAIVCWKRTPENPNPYPEGYGLDHFGIQVEDLDAALEERRRAPVVVRDPLEVLGVGEVEDTVVVPRRAAILGLSKISDAGIALRIRTADLLGAIRGSIVRNDELEARERLRKDRVDGLLFAFPVLYIYLLFLYPV